MAITGHIMKTIAKRKPNMVGNMTFASRKQDIQSPLCSFTKYGYSLFVSCFLLPNLLLSNLTLYVRHRNQLVLKVPLAGKDHRNAVFVGGGDDIGILL